MPAAAFGAIVQVMNKSSSTIVTVVRVVAISDCDTADIVHCSEIHRPPRMSGVHAGTRFSVIATINSQTCHSVPECADLAGRLLPCHVLSCNAHNHNPLRFCSCGNVIV